MTDLSDYLDSEGIEAPDEPPACFACASRRREGNPRAEYLERVISEAVADLEGGAPREVVAVNLSVAVGPF